MLDNDGKLVAPVELNDTLASMLDELSLAGAEVVAA